MSTSSGPSFVELSPELFPVIVEHVPLVYRPETLLALALTCHRIHEIVFPELVYDSVRLVGEDQALTILDDLISKAELVSQEDIQKRGNPSLSHCIHHLCLDSSIGTPIRSRSSLDALRKLLEVNGLWHLMSLRLRVDANWDGTEDDDSAGFITLPSSFFISLGTRCPHLQRIHISDVSQTFQREWIEPHIFSLEGLTNIRIGSDLLNYPTPTFNLSRLPSNLQALDLRLAHHSLAQQKTDATELLGCIIPNLHTLILDDMFISDPLCTNAFWRAHPKIERLEIYSRVEGNWFNDFQTGMLEHLKFLRCNVDHALVLLPRVSKSLIALSIWETYNAQGLYLLRVMCQGGVLPALRSLGIHSNSGNSPKPREGHRWREDANGVVSMADAKKPAKKFDGNYIMSLSKAAPNVEDLELMGTSNDTIDSLTTSLSMFPRLHRLTLSGAINGYSNPFFPCCPNWEEYSEFISYRVNERYYGKYAPATFDEAALDLANSGCCTLEVITMGNAFGELSIKDGLSRKVVRESDEGVVMELRKTRAYGNIIGGEDEW